MAKTKQKKIKFSKGQISERLLERTDLEILDSSASEITNLVSTPYGSVQTRQGTEYLDMLEVPAVYTITNNPSTNAQLGLYLIKRQDLYLTSAVVNTELLIKWDFSQTYINKVVLKYELYADVPVKIYKDSAELIETVTLTGTEYEVTVDDNISSFYILANGNKSPTSGLVIGWKTGIEFIGKTLGQVRIERFIFNEDNEYILVIETGKITIMQNDVIVSSVVDNRLTGTIIQELNFSQKEDVMVITHPSIAPLELSRISYDKGFDDWALKTGWAFTSNELVATAVTTGNDATITLPLPLNPNKYYVIEFYIENYSAGQVKPFWTSSTSSAGGQLKSANGQYFELIAPAVDKTAWTTVIFQAGTAFTGKVTNVKIYGDVEELFLTGDTTGNVIGWLMNSLPLENIPKYAFNGETVTRYTSTMLPDVTDGLVTITQSGSPKITFTSASVGQYIDGGGGRVKITQYISADIVKGYTIIPFYTAGGTNTFTNWDYISGYEAVWSATRGYPSSCLFYQQRLWFGGSEQRPNTIWASRVDDYNNFLNVGNFNNDAIDVTIDANQSAEILALYPNRGIQVFCAGSEWIIPEGNLTPNGISISKNTANGIKQGIVPVDISGTTLFIEKSGQSLLSFVYTDAQASYITSQISMLTDLIVDPIDMDVIYHSTQNKANYLYIVLSDGTMIVACILLDQQIQSFVKFETNGEIKDVCVLGDDVYLLVDRDTLTLEKFGDYKTDMTKSYAVAGDGTVTVDTIYEGKEVHAWSTTEDYGTHTVSGGEIDIDETSGSVFIGLDFDYSLTSNKIAINTQTDNIEKRISKATVVTNDTDTLTFCGQQITQDDDVFDFYGVTSPARDVRFTVTGTFDYIEILSILLNINYGDK